MVQYNLIDIQIHENTNSRGTYRWLECRLDRVDKCNPSQLPRFFILNEYTVQEYMAYAVADPTATTAAGHTIYKVDIAALKQQAPNLATKDQIIRKIVPLPEVYAQVYKNNVTAEQAFDKKPHMRGDYVRNIQGEITPVTSITLWLELADQDFFDENTGIVTTRKGFVENVNDVVRRAIERGYKKYPTAQPQIASFEPQPEPQIEQQEEAKEAEIERLRQQLDRLQAE